MTRTAKDCKATVMFPELFKMGWADLTEKKGMCYRKEAGLLLCTKNLAFFINKKIYISVVAKTMHYNAVQCVFYYLRYQTLLLEE